MNFFLFQTLLVAALSLGACTKSSQTTIPVHPKPVVDGSTPEPAQNVSQPKVPGSAVAVTPVVKDEDSVQMTFPRKDLADYGLNPDTLYYDAEFVDEQGTTLAKITRTKLVFDAATSSAQVEMKVKSGSRGHVSLSVEDISDGSKYTGKSELITVRDDTTADIKLKRMDQGSVDAGLTIDLNIDRALQIDPIDVVDGNQTDDADDEDQIDVDQDGGSGNTQTNIQYKQFEGTISDEQLNTWRLADQSKRGSDGRYWKYFYIDQVFYIDKNKANIARVGVFKALNHTAMENTSIVTGEDASEGYGALFAFDIRKYWGAKGENKWRILAAADRRAKIGMISAPAGNRVRPFANPDMPKASRLAFNLTFPDLYNQMIETPPYERELLRQLGIPFNQAEAWAAQKDAIVFGSRISALRRTGDGRPYWASADDFDGREGNPIPHLARYRVAPSFRQSPAGMVGRPDAQTIASEAWLEMKNGLIAYYIWGNAGQERGRAELFVIDPRNVAVQYGHKYLETGRSCITCHVAGVQAAPSDMATAIKDGTLQGTRLEEAKRYWTSNEKLAELYQESNVKFASAMREIVNQVSDGSAVFNNEIVVGAQQEPVLMLLELIDKGIR